MATEVELRETIDALTRGRDAATIERDPGATIVPSSELLESGSRRVLAAIDALDGGARFELKGTIGEGGMGVVRVATQTALGREVAVKALKPEHRNEQQTAKLLREAWITGGLEHPNVIPVYDIALEADGSPLIVLKKVEGDEWAGLMHDPEAVKVRFGSEDPLEWNLRILMQVCNAVRFAHSRGVLHRDLKPQNVMIGAFGEVYVVDWGIAVRLVDDGSGRFPLASEATKLAGTPHYMAPEMLGGPGSRLSERTDVYLLGGLLYEIVSGVPPHRGDALMELVLSIVESEPELSERVPPELARIIRRAMDPEPEGRFESAEQLRLALQGYLEHRDASRLAARASERRAELDALLAASVGAAGDDPEAREPIYRLFGECRFGFRHALEVWPTDAVREELDGVVGAMVEYELAQDEPEAARSLLSEMASVPEELARRVDEARRDRLEEEAELRRLHADLDPAGGRRTRGVVAMIVGVLWAAGPFVSHLVLKLGLVTFTGWANAAVSAGFLAVMIGLGIGARDSMRRTAINRRIGTAALLGIAVQLVTALSGVWLGRDPWQVVHEQFVGFVIICVMLALSVDRWIWACAAGYAAGYVAIPLLGMDSAFLVMGLCNLITLAVAFLLWWRPPSLPDEAREGVMRRREQRRRRLAGHLDPPR